MMSGEAGSGSPQFGPRTAKRAELEQTVQSEQTTHPAGALHCRPTSKQARQAPAANPHHCWPTTHPHVNPQQRDEPGGRVERVLVGAGGHHQRLGLWVIRQPAPTRALHGSCLGVESLHQALQGAKLRVDCLLQCTIGWLVLLRQGSQHRAK